MSNCKVRSCNYCITNYSKQEYIVSLDLSDLYLVYIKEVVDTNKLDTEELFYLIVENIFLDYILDDELTLSLFSDNLCYRKIITPFQNFIEFDGINQNLLHSMYKYIKNCIFSIVKDIVKDRELTIYPDKWVGKTLYIVGTKVPLHI